MITDKHGFFVALAPKRESVSLPGTDQEVALMELTSGQRSLIMQKVSDGASHYETCAMMVALSCELLDESDAPELLEKIGEAALLELSDHVIRLGGIGEEAIEEAEKK